MATQSTEISRKSKSSKLTASQWHFTNRQKQVFHFSQDSLACSVLMHHASCVTWYDSLSFLSLASIAGWRSYCAKLQTILRRDPCLWISLWISGCDHNQVLEFIAERCIFRFGSWSNRLVRSARWYKTASDDGANMFNDASRRRRWIGSHSGASNFHGKQEISIQGWPSQW